MEEEEKEQGKEGNDMVKEEEEREEVGEKQGMGEEGRVEGGV